MGLQVFTTGYQFSDKRHVTGCACRKDPCHSTIPYTGDLEFKVLVVSKLWVRICIYCLGVLCLGQGHVIAWEQRYVTRGVLCLGQGHVIAWEERYVTGQTRGGPGARHGPGMVT